MRALRCSSNHGIDYLSKLCIGEDLNGHVGSTRVGFNGVHGDLRYGSRNQKGEGILNFVLAYDLIVENTLFRKSLSYSNF
jgi:hypothetical protein